MAWYREEMSQESLDTTRRVTAAVFSEQLKGIVFDKILVKPIFPFGDEDEYGYVEIKAIYEGEWERLRAVRPSGLLTTLRDSLWGRRGDRVSDPSPHHEIGMGPAP